jgi:hydrogenase small subunit
MGIRNAFSEHDTIEGHLERSGVDRRDFIAFCGKLMAAAPFGLGITSFLSVEAVAEEVGRIRRPSVIWLHMQDCTGCTETLLRTSQPDLATLIFDVISLDYHETVMAASGHDAELALRDAMTQNDGKYVLVVEGSIPTKDAGIYLKVGGKWGTDLLRDTAAHSAAVISMGSCSSWAAWRHRGRTDRRRGRGLVGRQQADREHPRLPSESVHPSRNRAAVRESGSLPELDS